MKYRLLADTGVFVSELCLGAMTFGGRGQMWEVIGGLDQPAVDAIVGRALDAGINFIDTADVYSAGESETMVGKAIAGRRREVVLATKVRGRMGAGPNQVGLSRLHITTALEDSLARLGTDYIDLYQIHRFDPLTSLEDTLRALDDLVRAGKVRYLGCSNLAAWQLMKALAISRAQNLERFKCTQSYLLARRAGPRARDDSTAEGSRPWAAGLEPARRRLPVGQVHERRSGQGRRRSARDFRLSRRSTRTRRRHCRRDPAHRRGARCDVAQVALAWVLARDAVTSVIIGARTPAQLEDNLKSIDCQLSASRPTGAGRGQRAHARISGVDGRVALGSPSGEERRFKKA